MGAAAQQYESTDSPANTNISYSSIVNGFSGLKLHEQALLIASLCYVLGFIITNIHLASHGIASVELFRFRYIATGFLFLVFVCIVVLPVHGLYNTFRRFADDSSINVIVLAIIYSLVIYGPVILGLSLLGIFTPSVSRPPPVIPDFYITDSMRQELINMLSMWAGISIISFLLLILTKRLTREKITAKEWKKLLLDMSTLLGFLLTITLGMLLVSLNNTSGWLRYLGTAFLLYAIAAVWLIDDVIVRWTYKEGNKSQVAPPAKPDVQAKSTSRYYWQLSLLLAVPIVTVIIYLLYAYPFVPQQLGGGSTIPVKVIAGNTTLDEMLNRADSETRIYLVDRTAENVILQLERNNSTDFVEVPNSEITLITYGVN